MEGSNYMDSNENNLVTDLVMENNTISPYKLFLRIWIKPRETIRYIINTNPTKYVFIIAMVYGMLEFLNKAIEKNYGESMSLVSIFIQSIVFGSLLGILALFINAALIKWTGKWIGGKANFDEIMAAIAWGIVPLLTGVIILYIPLFIFFGKDLFINEIVFQPNSFKTIFLIIFGVIEIIALIWTIIVFLKCLSEVQGFSVWKALGNTLLAFLVVFIPLIILALIIF